MFEELVANGLPPVISGDIALDLLPLGYLGIDAARRGDTTSAEAMIQRLGSVDRAYLLGSNAYWQGRIAAQLGQCERAVGFLREALRRGTSVYDGLRPEDQEFVKLRSCPAFRQLMEPKG